MTVITHQDIPQPVRLYNKAFHRVNVGLSHDGIDDYTIVEPFTVYGWREITIAELIYAFRPKANTLYSKTGMIGDTWIDYPSTFHVTQNLTNYTYIYTHWKTRKPDGTPGYFSYNWISFVNQWIFFVRRFTANREYSIWINGEKKYSVTVPSDYKTVLEWDPETATRPERYKRFVLGANSQLSEWMTVMYGFVCIYDRALTEEEISYNLKHIYEPITDGLVLWLPMNECAGNRVLDYSGYGNHGTIYGATWINQVIEEVL